jgi:hypothetical protein
VFFGELQTFVRWMIGWVNGIIGLIDGWIMDDGWINM